MKEKIYFMLSMIIFGAVGVFAKYIELSSSKIALFLSLIGTMVLLLIFMGTKQKVLWYRVKENVVVLLLASVALSGNWIFLFQAYKETTIANAALSYYFAPVLVILLAHFFLKEKLSFPKVVCIGIALLGLFLILQNSGKVETGGNHLLGIGYGLVAAGFYASLTIVNQFIRGLDGIVNTFLQLGLAVIILLLFVLFTEGFNFSLITRETIIWMIVLGMIHGGFGFYLFFAGMKGLNGQSIAVLSYMDPLTSLLISTLVIGENLSLQQMIGAALLLGSVSIGEFCGKKTLGSAKKHVRKQPDIFKEGDIIKSKSM